MCFHCEGKRLDFSLWLLAFPRYALAAAASRQLSFVDAMQHFANCHNSAIAAKAECRTTALAVVYDEKSRFAWKNLSMALWAQFNVGEYARKFSEAVLREARAEHDLVHGRSEDASEGSKRAAQSWWPASESKIVTLRLKLIPQAACLPKFS